MPTVAQDVAAIRTAVYGRDVREAIADGIENCYSDVSRAKTLADQAVADATQANNTAAQGVNNLSQTIADANTATQRANDAASAADTAKNDANDAAAAANRAVQNLTGQVNDAIAELPDAVNEAVDEETQKFARIDGYYKDMTVGDSEQLISSQFAKDKAIYAFRKAGGTKDIGNRAYLDKIVGGTIGWNQQFNVGSRTRTLSGIAVTTSDGVKLMYEGTATTDGYIDAFAYTGTDWFLNKLIVGHKYLFVAKSTDGKLFFVVNGPYTDTNGKTYVLYAPTVQPTYFFCRIALSNGEAVSGSGYIQCFDLTQMFGTAVADYIYSLGDAGIALFRSWFPGTDYAPNTGELISVEGLQKRKTVGFNLWDEEWEVGDIWNTTGKNVSGTGRIRCKNYIPVIGGQSYCFYCKAGNKLCLYAYDSDKNFIGVWHTGSFNVGDSGATDIGQSTVVTLPSNCVYIKIKGVGSYGATYNHDICVNLSWSGTRNGEYAPYESHEYPLDSSLTLRGVPKLVDGEVKWDGDEYTPDGKVKRRYGIVDLGTLNWSYDGSCSAVVPFMAKNEYASPNLKCSKYPTMPLPFSQFTYGIRYTGNASSVSILDPAYTDAAAFKAAMSGVMLVYELATPTEETAEPFTEVQIVDDWGIEEFISDSIVPVGHETRYPANLRDKLQHLPDLATGDGNYMIQQSGSQMTLVPSKVPQAPTANGTYVLKVTVSGGTPTYKWEAAT